MPRRIPIRKNTCLAAMALVVAGSLLVPAAAADQGPRPGDSRGPADDETAALIAVSFAGGRDIQRDDDSVTYSAPHWLAAPPVRSPYLIQAGETLTIANARVRIFGTISGPPMIRGWREDGRDIPPTPASRLAGTTNLYEITDVKARSPFRDKTVAFFNTFDLDWRVSLDAGRTWTSAGISKNPVYVCLAPNAVTFPLALFIVHTACSWGSPG
jgi:hypothetical protein